MKIALMTFILLITFLLSGCSVNMGNYSVISTKQIEWERGDEFYLHNQRIQGRDVSHIIVLFPTKTIITIQEAVENALNRIPGAIAMTNVTTKSSWFYIPYIYGQQNIYVEGNVVLDPKLLPGYQPRW